MDANQDRLVQAAFDGNVKLQKRPVAWRVKDYADRWIIFQDEGDAFQQAQDSGAVMQGLYVRDGT